MLGQAGHMGMPVMTDQRISLGGIAWLWVAKADTPHCVINAHGGYYKNCQKFDLKQVAPRVVLNFYTTDEHMLANGEGPLFIVGNSGYTKVVEQFTATKNNMVDDFQLDKSQQGDRSGNSLLRRIKDRLHDQTGKSGGVHGYSTVRQEIEAPHGTTGIKAHIVTVRDRFRGDSGCSLGSLLPLITQAKPEITTIHCGFCRVIIGTDVNDMPQGPRFDRAPTQKEAGW
jgi:hypothetical protein